MARRIAGPLRSGWSLLLVPAAVVTFSGVLASVAAMTLLARDPASSALPTLFDAYADLFPGQPVNTIPLETRGFVCRVDPLASPGDISQQCIFDPETGPIRTVRLVIVDGYSSRIEFSFQRDALTIGDLSLLLGPPEVKRVSRFLFLEWPNRRASILSSRQDRLSYFVPISLITFG